MTSDIAEKLEEILDVLAEIRGGEPQRLRRLERASSGRRMTHDEVIARIHVLERDLKALHDRIGAIEGGSR